MDQNESLQSYHRFYCQRARQVNFLVPPRFIICIVNFFLFCSYFKFDVNPKLKLSPLMWFYSVMMIIGHIFLQYVAAVHNYCYLLKITVATYYSLSLIIIITIDLSLLKPFQNLHFIKHSNHLKIHGKDL